MPIPEELQQEALSLVNCGKYTEARDKVVSARGIWPQDLYKKPKEPSLLEKDEERKKRVLATIER